MSKKNRKSLFTWCIRTLAISLLPSMLLISCATSDGDDDLTSPTVTSAQKDKVMVGTGSLEITFSEAVNDVTGNAADGACDLTKTLQLTDAEGNCYGIDVSQAGNTYTITPKNSLVTGSYTLAIGTGITDAAGNPLNGSSFNGAEIISFTVDDALTTVVANLTASLAGIDEGAAIAAAAKTAASADGVTNNLLNVIPAAFGGS